MSFESSNSKTPKSAILHSPYRRAFLSCCAAAATILTGRMLETLPSKSQTSNFKHIRLKNNLIELGFYFKTFLLLNRIEEPHTHTFLLFTNQDYTAGMVSTVPIFRQRSNNNMHYLSAHRKDWKL